MQPVVTLTLNPAVDKNARVEHVVAERKLRCEAPTYEPGGGGINVARAMQKLGGAAAALYLAGGPAGETLRGLLAEEGIAQHVVPTEGWTRENFIAFEAATEQQYRFGMPGPAVQEREWRRVLDRLAALDPAPAYVVVSGSLPPGVPDDFCARVVRRAKAWGGRVVVDTSGPALRAALGEPAYLLKPNVGELAGLVGHPIEGEEALEALEALAMQFVAERRCVHVLVSLGAGGALLASAGGPVRLRAPVVPVQSKVGAGDSMVAGCALMLARGRPAEEAARFGVAAGAVMTPGTQLCRRADAERLFAQVTRDEAARREASSAENR